MKIPFTSNAGTKIMALVLAVFLWSFAYLENLKDGSVTYLVSLSAPEGLRIDEPNRRIEVAVRGPRKIVEPLSAEPQLHISKQITQQDIESFADADTIPLTINLTIEDLSPDPSLTFPNLPRPITVTLRRIDTRMLPVEIRVTGAARPGYVYVPEDSYSWPRSVRVTGPRSLLDGAESIRTEEIDITGLSSTLDVADVRLVSRIDDEPVRLLDEKVYAHVAIVQQLESKDLDVPIQVLAAPGYPYRLNADRSQARVTLTGPAETIAGIRAADVVVFYRVDDSMTPREVPYPVDLMAWLPGRPSVSVSLEGDPVNVRIEPRSP